MTFAGVKPFPTAANQAATANPRAVIGGNRPPLDEMIVAEFEEGLRADPNLMTKVAQLIEKGKAPPPCDSEDMAGRYGDFIKMVSAATKAIEAEREKHNRPILTAQRALKARADSYTAPLAEAGTRVRRLLDGFMAEQARIAAEKRRQAEEEARKAAQAELDRRAAAEEGDAAFAEVAPLVEIRPAEIEKPVARGDYGARVGTMTVWLHEITSVRQLPDRLLKHPKVMEALDKVVAAEIRGGAREIKGVRIWDEQRAAVR
jgi:hypothetical protein